MAVCGCLLNSNTPHHGEGDGPTLGPRFIYQPQLPVSRVGDIYIYWKQSVLGYVGLDLPYGTKGASRLDTSLVEPRLISTVYMIEFTKHLIRNWGQSSNLLPHAL